MSSLVLTGDTSGQVTLAAPAVAGTTTLTLQATTGTVALQSDGLGFSQTYQDVTASRTIGTTYTNSTGKPIFVSWYGTNSALSGVAYGQVGGVTIARSTGVASSAGAIALTFIVPPSATYTVAQGTAVSTTTNWFELR